MFLGVDELDPDSLVAASAVPSSRFMMGMVGGQWSSAESDVGWCGHDGQVLMEPDSFYIFIYVYVYIYIYIYIYI